MHRFCSEKYPSDFQKFYYLWLAGCSYKLLYRPLDPCRLWEKNITTEIDTISGRFEVDVLKKHSFNLFTNNSQNLLLF